MEVVRVTALEYCPTHPVAGGAYVTAIVLTMIAYGALCFAAIAYNATHGRPWRSAICVWMTSAIPLLAITAFLEHRSILPLLGIHRSWAMTFLDPVILPLLIALSAVAWRRLKETDGWYTRKKWGIPVWLLFAILLGVAAAVAFHNGETAVYDVLRLISPSKELHDYAAYPALAAAFIYLVVPVWASPRKVGLRLWLAAVVLSVLMAVVLWHEAKYSLATSAYHPQFDWAHGGHVITCEIPSRR